MLRDATLEPNSHGLRDRNTSVNAANGRRWCCQRERASVFCRARTAPGPPNGGPGFERVCVVLRSVLLDDVEARAAVEDVLAGTADEGVVAVAAEQGVVAVAPDEEVVAGAAV